MALTTRTDITAVKFYKNLILAGIGNSINVFHKSTTKLLHTFIALNGQKIYAFVPSPHGEKILVFGGKQFIVVVPTGLDDKDVDNVVLLGQFEPKVCDDWLHSAVWIDDNTVALLTAHNVVQKWDITTQKLLSQHESKDNSILYSGLLLPLLDDVLVMAGTVFSEVIIHKCKDERPLQHLKGHKGVIFSITCKPELHIIVTTSDDRAVRIWGPTIKPAFLPNTGDYWENINIVCIHEVYGHLARVMRSCITNNLIISVGEDSAICYWGLDGKLLKKTLTHQNSCIWSVDCDDDHLITGGGDCGIIIHPLSVATDYSQNYILNIGVTSPKMVEFTARKNIMIIDENKILYYDFDTGNKFIHELNHRSTYRLLSLSSCKQLGAVADMTGKLDMFVETCKGHAAISRFMNTQLNIGKVLSMHWAGNRHLVFCTENGKIAVFTSYDGSLEEYARFTLPFCKESLLTAAAIDVTKNYFILGDRCGNIHMFVKGQENPIKSFSKVHGRYGPRSIEFREKDIITTGRDHSIKYFRLNEGSFKLMSSKDVPFAWLEKFLDKELNLVCGFQERVFVVYNIKDNSKVVEVPCGGGHRSFDAVKYITKVNDSYEEIIKLVYLKDTDINVVTIDLKKIVSKNIINGSHAKEINCLTSHKVGNVSIYISGGEDTTLRVSSINAAIDFQDEICFKHLSSVRTLKTHVMNDNNFLLVSAGGRAQICIRKLKIILNSKLEIVSEELVDYLVKGTDKERRGNQPWKIGYIDFDPEMRIMDIDLLEAGDNFIIFAACSDGYVRAFIFRDKSKTLQLVNAVKIHNTCLLKMKLINILNRNVLITCSTRGEVTLSDVSNIESETLAPFFTFTTNKSGINSLSLTVAHNTVLIATGGDDNTIHMALLEVSDQNLLSSIKIRHSWKCSKYHSSQITGLCVVDDYLLSTSIDQRITLLQWGVHERGITCKFVCQMYTNVADVQGMHLMCWDRYYENDPFKKGSLYRKDTDGSAHKLDSYIDVSNGLRWDLKEKAYYADSLGSTYANDRPSCRQTSPEGAHPRSPSYFSGPDYDILSNFRLHESGGRAETSLRPVQGTLQLECN